MSIFVLSDPHLSINSETDKSMEVFGDRWLGYQTKLEQKWRAVVSYSDSVVLPGDISWAMTLSEAIDDFRFINSLPGKKYIGKGNHDFWWSSVTKMKNTFTDNGINTIDFLYNNAYIIENRVICGSRGWYHDENSQNTVGTVDYTKMIDREAIRLELSLGEAKKLSESVPDAPLPITAFMHFPPIWGSFRCDKLLTLLERYSVDECCFGHIHGAYSYQQYSMYGNMKLIFASADYLNFLPFKLH